MKKVLVDANVINFTTIDKILNSNVKDKIGNEYKLYGSDILFKQTLAEQYLSGEKYYTPIKDFIKIYFESEFLASSTDIVQRELASSYKNKNRYSIFTKEHLCEYDDVKKGLIDVMKDSHEHKKQQIKSYNEFCNDISKRMSKLKSNDEWKKGCYDFINDYKFEVEFFNAYLDKKDKYNKKVFEEMILLWWRYKLIRDTFIHFKYKDGTRHLKNIMHKREEIPRDSYLGTSLEMDVYKLDHDIFLQQGRDKDSINDIQYLVLMQDFDILLTTDSTFMKHCFDKFYGNTDKQIITAEEFINI